MATIHELLDLIITTAQQLKGEAPADEPATQPPAPSRFVDGKSAPDSLGRVELELVDRLIAEFGEAPNGYRIPRLWYVADTDLSKLDPVAQGDHAMNVGGAAFNKGIAFTYQDQAAWFGKKVRAKADAIPHCLAWNGSLQALEAALRARIALILDPTHYPAYTPAPTAGALDTVSGYLALQ